MGNGRRREDKPRKTTLTIKPMQSVTWLDEEGHVEKITNVGRSRIKLRFEHPPGRRMELSKPVSLRALARRSQQRRKDGTNGV